MLAFYELRYHIFQQSCCTTTRWWQVDLSLRSQSTSGRICTEWGGTIRVTLEVREVAVSATQLAVRKSTTSLLTSLGFSACIMCAVSFITTTLARPSRNLHKASTRYGSQTAQSLHKKWNARNITTRVEVWCVHRADYFSFLISYR